jgi:hypothetical protein
MSATRARAISIRRNEEHHDVIFSGRPAEMSPRELHVALGPALRAWIRAACTWRQIAIGDHRSLSFSVSVAPDVQACVRFWSEPLEAVRWEISSAQKHPSTGQWLPAMPADRLEAFGFTIGGDREHYHRSVALETPADVATVAGQVIDILYNAFDYRGRQPITATLVHEGRAELKATFEAFTAHDLSKVFTGLGFRVEPPVVEDGDLAEPRVLRFRKHGVSTRVHLWDRSEKGDVYARVRFEAEMEVPEEDRQRLLDESIVLESGETHAMVSVVHAFSGGVTLAWLVARIEEWDAMLREGQRTVRKGRPHRPAPPATRGTIH